MNIFNFSDRIDLQFDFGDINVELYRLYLIPFSNIPMYIKKREPILPYIEDPGGVFSIPGIFSNLDSVITPAQHKQFLCNIGEISSSI